MTTYQTHASKLTAINNTLSQTYTLSPAVLAAYYQAAKTLVEAKKTEIIDTRNVVEPVEQYDGISSESPESIKAFQAYSEANSNPTLDLNTAVATAETEKAT